MSPRAKVKAGGIVRTSIDLTWQTPDYVLERVRAFFGGPIPFDPATAPDNPTKALRFCAGPKGTLFAKESLESKNGLEVSWDWPFWVNPPFNREWIEKIGREGAKQTGVALLPCNRFEEPYLQATLLAATFICWVNTRPFDPVARNGRIAFVSSIDGVPCAANPFGSMLLGFNCTEEQWTRAFAPIATPHLGTSFRLVPVGRTA